MPLKIFYSRAPSLEQAQFTLSPPSWLQKKWVKNSLTILIFIGLFLLLRAFMQGDVMQGKAPVMKVQSLTGEVLDLQALTQQGQPVLVHIWATWCPICDLSKGGIESIAKDYAVINIATQSGSDAELLAFAQKNNMNPAIIVNDTTGMWMQTFGTKAVPADFIIAPNGEIAFVEIGLTSAWGLRLRLWWAQQ
ncbi:Membrane protein, suppressor for copper-sensitivity ScsD [hydrothermal vent metagenome]|uniref:Membrane protein, suppressor for copper-sensitivity ScsD n=1 Tax=hydrothermal vent metagenome TaxID=652676 RepID=A0A3B0WWA7_9ZZZZ